MPTWLLRLIESVIAALIAIFAPIGPMLLTCGMLVIVDMITGMMAARKRKEPITSRKMKSTIVKGLVYQVAIVMAFLVETYLAQHSIPVLNITATIIGVTELKSVYENLEVITNKRLLNSIVKAISKPQDPT